MLSLSLLMVASFSFCQSEVISFDKSTLKFKKVDEGNKVSLTYFFKNSGKHALSVIPPDVDCSCTEVIIPQQKIAGGARDSIIVVFDTKDKIGFQERQVKIQFTHDLLDANFIDKTITFKGVVKASEATKNYYKKNKLKD